MICPRFLTAFDADGHIETIKSLYREKCSLMLGSMDNIFPEYVKYTRPEGGLFLWCTLTGGYDVPRFVQTALSKFVAVVPGTAFMCDPAAPSQSFRLNYSTPSKEQISRGIEILGEILKTSK